MAAGTEREQHGGFTLIEVLVAFTILALSLAAVMQAFSTGLLGLRKSQAHVTALMQGRSKLAEIGRTVPLEESETLGRLADGTQWRVTIERADDSEDTALELASDLGLVLFDVVVEIERQDDASVTLRTRRLSQEPL